MVQFCTWVHGWTTSHFAGSLVLYDLRMVWHKVDDLAPNFIRNVRELWSNWIRWNICVFVRDFPKEIVCLKKGVGFLRKSGFWDCVGSWHSHSVGASGRCSKNWLWNIFRAPKRCTNLAKNIPTAVKLVGAVQKSCTDCTDKMSVHPGAPSLTRCIWCTRCTWRYIHEDIFLPSWHHIWRLLGSCSQPFTKDAGP